MTYDFPSTPSQEGSQKNLTSIQESDNEGESGSDTTEQDSCDLQWSMRSEPEFFLEDMIPELQCQGIRFESLYILVRNSGLYLLRW